MRKKFFGFVLPAFIVAAAFFIGASVARVQAEDVFTVSSDKTALLSTPEQTTVATAPATTSSITGGTSCSYCRTQYMATGNYTQYMNCLYYPPCY